jgi:choline-sulfatase
MRILYIDMDCVRPDHLGCYGYSRNTSPHIDQIAREGTIFRRVYASDTPCLPSRAALFSGRFGINNGVVGHAGAGARMHYPNDGHNIDRGYLPLPMVLRQSGLRTVSISPFADRHAAWWSLAGFGEVIDPARRGQEIASQVNPHAVAWLRANAAADNWFVHLNYWDAHRPYRTPMEYGNPFEGEPGPKWLTQELIDGQRERYGPRSACEPQGFRPDPRWPREPHEIRDLQDCRRWIDGYDTGIRYMDDHIGQVLSVLDEQKVLDDTLIIFSGDHGENLGELNVYGDHHTADEFTCHVPMIVRWPGVTRPGSSCDALLYQLDLCPTLCEMRQIQPSARWDGQSFAAALRGESLAGRDHLVLSHGAWSCQRSVLAGSHIMIRTYHAGLHEWPDVMLFDLERDPHEVDDLAGQAPEALGRCEHLLAEWWARQSTRPAALPDPMMRMIQEGGPLYVRDQVEPYAKILRENGRTAQAQRMLDQADRYPHFQG